MFSLAPSFIVFGLYQKSIHYFLITIYQLLLDNDLLGLTIRLDNVYTITTNLVHLHTVEVIDHSLAILLSSLDVRDASGWISIYQLSFSLSVCNLDVDIKISAILPFRVTFICVFAPIWRYFITFVIQN